LIPAFIAASKTNAARIKSSSAVVQAPINTPSNSFPTTSVTETTLSGEGYNATNESISLKSSSYSAAYLASGSARKYYFFFSNYYYYQICFYSQKRKNLL